MKKTFLIAMLALLPAFACDHAQDAPAAASQANTASAVRARPPLPGANRDADPALWVIRDADTTIYLFGTIHLLDGRTWFNDEVRTAFNASGELVLEAKLPDNPAALQTTIMRYAMDSSGRTISSRLTPAQNIALNAALARLGVPERAFDRFEPWFISLTLTAVMAQDLGLSTESGPETILTQAARTRAIPIGELEGMEFQIRIFDQLPDALQLTQLTQTLDELATAGDKLGPMLSAWSSGDVDRLGALTNEARDQDADGRALYRIVFTDRNRAWAGWIQRRMAQPGTVFIAVGAGHLAGPDSVQNMLRTLGVQSSRVPHVVAR